MQPYYDPAWVSGFYDRYAEKEWARWDRNASEAVKLHVHRHYLERWIRPGMRVLEAGAGSGRFTRHLAELGARVTVADLSPKQLELNQENGEIHGFNASVEERVLADICDLARFKDATFDAVVCYGGPLSYVFDRGKQALNELFRVAGSSAPLLLGVMSKWGTHREYLFDILHGGSGAQVLDIAKAGNLHPDTWPVETQRCHLFTSAELRALVEEVGGRIEALSASNTLASVHTAGLDGLRKDAGRWDTLLKLELDACSQPGCLDMGTHLIAVATR